jgi:hypothetical protein
MSYLLWLSRTAPAVWARESESIWAYPTILFLHTLGLGLLVGFTTAIDFRILGFSSRLPLAPMGRFFRLVWIGFWINALSGTALLVMAPAKLLNPTFAVKMACIGLGVVTALWIKREVFPSGLGTGPSDTAGVSTLARLLAISSLLLWAGAITAGRLMAYIGNGNAH